MNHQSPITNHQSPITNHQSPITNNKAFSLIEVMVAVGILGLMSVGIMSMTDYGFKSQAAVEQKYAANSLQGQIYNLLATTNVCNVNFGQAAEDAGGTKVIINAANTATAPVNITTLNRTVTPTVVAFQNYIPATGVPTYENNSIHILSMQLTNFQPVGGFPTFKGQYDLVVIIEKNKASTGVPQFAPKIIKLDVTLDQQWTAVAPTATQHKIQTCIAFGGNADQIWTKNADSTIYYNGANVGIGKTTPARSALDVVGTPNATNFAGILSESANAAGSPGFCSSSSAQIIYGCVGGVSGVGSFGPTDTTVGDYIVSSNTNIRLATGHPVNWTVAGAGGFSTTKMSILANGNVGIGTTTPASRLHVGGTAAGGNGILLNVNGSEGIILQPTSDFANPNDPGDLIFRNANGTLRSRIHSNINFVPSGELVLEANGINAVNIASNGNVGIGTTNPSAKLDVNGEVKFGLTAGLPCNATNEGQQRYNSVSKKMEFCNGTSWTPVGGGVSISNTVTANVCGNVGTTKSANCPVGFIVVGCGYKITWYGGGPRNAPDGVQFNASNGCTISLPGSPNGNCFDVIAKCVK